MKIVVIGLLVSSLFSTADAQRRSKGSINNAKPTVYIEYVAGLSASDTSNQSDPQPVWLRLKNNSRFGIRVDASGGVDEKRRDVTLYYDVIDKYENIAERYRCHVCSTNIIRPGGSLLFGVPASRLSVGSFLRVEFSFEWENDHNVINGLEPKHYVFFDYRDLHQETTNK
jgi:hypothetical protein